MNNLIPVVIGITGHRQLRNQDLTQLKDAVREQLKAVILRCPNSPVKLLTCLAEGSDQLCAEIALELNIGLIVALPMELSEYKLDFHSGALLNFEDLISKAEKVFVAPKVEESNQSFAREYYYRQADIYIATHSHCLIALWDGSSPKAGGCGTSETVDMVLNHSYQSVRCVHNQDGFVIHIMTPRTKEADNAGIVSYLGNEKVFNENIAKLNELNKDGGDPDKLSIKFGKRYHGTLMFLAILGTILTLAFLLYDNAMINWMLWILGFVLLVMTIIFRIANRSKLHQKYIEYRALAECLRIQNHLNRNGINIEISDCLTWTERFDNPWILKATQSFNVIRKTEKTEEIKKDWVLEQQLYHETAAEKAKQQLDRNNVIVKTALIVSIAIYILTLLFEYVVTIKLSSNVDFIRAILKIGVGTASAASFFAANYYGKLSIKRVYEDHVRMAKYFKTAAVYLENNSLSKQFLYELIDEELSENSNWCSYEKDNEIDLTI